jgi:glycosyltransferase involved in cell wall biosynthesis
LIKNREQIHIFGSAFESLSMMLLLWVATCLRLNCYIISEPYSPVPYGYFNDKGVFVERLKTFLRPKLYRFYMLALRRGLKGIFTISSLAIQQFENSGMPSDRLFPFGYFVPTEKVNNFKLIGRAANAQLRMVFIGSLIARKGLSTLIEAVQNTLGEGVILQLDVYGPGDISRYDFGTTSIRYMGCIPFGRAQQVLRDYNLLVLPSHYDGWGVVVNEALCAGVPVLCSDQVGARVLVETFSAGQVFPSGDVVALAELLFALADDPARLEKMRLACVAAAKLIQPASAAAYMLQVLSAESAKRSDIVSPWYLAS